MNSVKNAIPFQTGRSPVSVRNIFHKYGYSGSLGLKGLLQKLKTYRLVAIGDSVVWGQGLLNPEKTITLLADYLQERLPHLVVETKNFAHSGAIIGTPLQRVETRDGGWGELPNDYPTILRQLDISSPEPELFTNLIVLNGGLNDVNFRKIMIPYGEDIDPLCKAHCYEGMKLLLRTTHEKYPNAIIICSGYYKIFSHQSRLFGIALVLLALDIISTLTGFILGEEVINRCETFFRLSEKYLQKAVNDVNQAIGNKVLFVPCNWQDANAMFASDPFLFGLNADLSPQDHPELIQRRKNECPDIPLIEVDIPDVAIGDQRINIPDVSVKIPDLQCQRASVGHPNIRGAKSNADSIIAALETYNNQP